MRSIMIKGKWNSKDKILLMCLIGQVSCIVSFCKPLLPLSSDIMHCFSHIHCHYSCYSLWYLDAEYYLAPHLLYSLLGLLYSTTMHWCSSYIIAQNWFSANLSLSGLQPTTSVFCYSLFFVGLASQLHYFLSFDIMTKITWLSRFWVERSKLPR